MKGLSIRMLVFIVLPVMTMLTATGCVSYVRYHKVTLLPGVKRIKRLKPGEKVVVKVTTIPKVATIKEMQLLKKLIGTDLGKKGVAIINNENDLGTATFASVKVKVIKIYRVSRTKRFLFGALMGTAEIRALVMVRYSNDASSTFKVDAKAKDVKTYFHHIFGGIGVGYVAPFYGNTDLAFKSTAETIADAIGAKGPKTSKNSRKK